MIVHKTKVILDGVDIAHKVSKVAIIAQAGDVRRVELTIVAESILMNDDAIAITTIKVKTPPDPEE